MNMKRWRIVKDARMVQSMILLVSCIVWLQLYTVATDCNFQLNQTSTWTLVYNLYVECEKNHNNRIYHVLCTIEKYKVKKYTGQVLAMP